MTTETISARELRTKDVLNSVPQKVGFYKWFAPEDTARELLGTYFDSLKTYLSKGKAKETKSFYLLYVGVATNDTIRSRLDWHVNQKHDIGFIQTGYLSTFRQSISSLISQNQRDENSTNRIINTMIIEYTTSDYPVKSKEANAIIKSLESKEINEKHIPLNIMGNKSEFLKSFKKHLKAQRKLGKFNALTQLK